MMWLRRGLGRAWLAVSVALGLTGCGRASVPISFAGVDFGYPSPPFFDENPSRQIPFKFDGHLFRRVRVQEYDGKVFRVSAYDTERPYMRVDALDEPTSRLVSDVTGSGHHCDGEGLCVDAMGQVSRNDMAVYGVIQARAIGLTMAGESPFPDSVASYWDSDYVAETHDSLSWMEARAFMIERFGSPVDGGAQYCWLLRESGSAARIQRCLSKTMAKGDWIRNPGHLGTLNAMGLLSQTRLGAASPRPRTLTMKDPVRFGNHRPGEPAPDSLRVSTIHSEWTYEGHVYSHVLARNYKGRVFGLYARSSDPPPTGLSHLDLDVSDLVEGVTRREMACTSAGFCLETDGTAHSFSIQLLLEIEQDAAAVPTSGDIVWPPSPEDGWGEVGPFDDVAFGNLPSSGQDGVLDKYRHVFGSPWESDGAVCWLLNRAIEPGRVLFCIENGEAEPRLATMQLNPNALALLFSIDTN